MVKIEIIAEDAEKDFEQGGTIKPNTSDEHANRIGFGNRQELSDLKGQQKWNDADGDQSNALPENDMGE
jgi:hypothetical protein